MEMSEHKEKEHMSTREIEQESIRGMLGPDDARYDEEGFLIDREKGLPKDSENKND